MMAGEDACCLCVCVLVVLAIPITILSLSLVTHNPKIYVQDFYVPSLNNNNPTQSNATTLNTFLFIDLQLRNVMPFNGLRYEDLNITFFYDSNRSFPVASYEVPGFYQGLRKTARKRDVVRTRGLPWQDAFDKVSRGLTVDFALDLAMTVKLRRCGSYINRKTVVLTAALSLDGSGEQVDKKVIPLH